LREAVGVLLRQRARDVDERIVRRDGVGVAGDVEQDRRKQRRKLLAVFLAVASEPPSPRQ
jgi:hypothetical protein